MTESMPIKQSPFKGHKPTEEARAKMSAAKKGKNNPMFGKKRSEETKAKISAAINQPESIAKRTAARIGEKNPMKQPNVKAKHSAAMKRLETRAKMSASHKGHTQTKETRAKISFKMRGANTGKNNGNWNGGSSFEPYCPRFNEPLKERYRNHYGRVCILSDILKSVMGPESGLDDFDGHEIFSGRRLSVHHIYGNKMAGCDGTDLALIPLQGRYNTMKVDGLKLEDHPFYITLFMLKDQEKRHFS